MVYNVVEDTKTIYSVREIPIVSEVKAFTKRLRNIIRYVNIIRLILLMMEKTLFWCGHWIEHCGDFAGFVKWTISIVIRYERHLPVRSMIMVFRHVLFLISWGIVCYLTTENCYILSQV